MEVEREKIVQQATEFQAENDELLDDPMVTVDILEAIIHQGSAIAVVFGDETESRLDAAADAAREYEECYRAQKTRPKELMAMRREHQELKSEADAYHAPFVEFIRWMEKVRAVYYNAAGIEDPDPADTAETAARLERESAYHENEGPRLQPFDLQTFTDEAVQEVHEEIAGPTGEMPAWWQRIFGKEKEGGR